MSGGFVEVSWRTGLGTGSREVESETKKMRQEAGAGGNAAREGGRDACAGRSTRSVVARHLKEPICLTSPQTVPATVHNNKPKVNCFCSFRPQARAMVARTVPNLSALSPAERSARLPRTQSKTRSALSLRHAAPHTSTNRRSEALLREGGAEALCGTMSELSYWRVGSMRVLGG